MGNTTNNSTQMPIHDVVMIGAGPSALAAAVYTTRENLQTVLYEKAVIGGLAAITDKIDNYPGFADGVAGLDLAEQLQRQAERFGAQIELGEVSSLRKDGNDTIVTVDGQDVCARAVLIATGSAYNKLGIPGEDALYGRGVHYCATCDGAFYKGKRLVVIGGGNFFRGAELSQAGMDRSRADYMGMLGTVMNSLALQDFLEQEGIDTRVQSAITMPQVAETYIPRRAIRHMQKDRVVIFGAGAGLPYFSTDTVAAQRALEIHADEVLVAKNGVDGIYTADPNKDPNAERLYNLTYDEAMQRNIRVLDQTAFSLCRDNNVTMRVFGMQGEDNVTRAIKGEKMGTLVTR